VGHVLAAGVIVSSGARRRWPRRDRRRHEGVRDREDEPEIRAIFAKFLELLLVRSGPRADFPLRLKLYEGPRH
jgi:hypothetical protein